MPESGTGACRGFSALAVSSGFARWTLLESPVTRFGREGGALGPPPHLVSRPYFSYPDARKRRGSRLSGTLLIAFRAKTVSLLKERKASINLTTLGRT